MEWMLKKSCCARAFLLLFTLLIKFCVFSLRIPFGRWHPEFEDLEGYYDFRLAYVPLVSNFTAARARLNL